MKPKMEHNYVICPGLLWESVNLTLADKALMFILINKARKDDYVFVGLETLIRETGFCNKTLIKMLARLEELKLIHQQPMSAEGHNVGSIRYINWHHPIMHPKKDEQADMIPEKSFAPTKEVQEKAQGAFNKWRDKIAPKTKSGF